MEFTCFKIKFSTTIRSKCESLRRLSSFGLLPFWPNWAVIFSKMSSFRKAYTLGRSANWSTRLSERHVKLCSHLLSGFYFPTVVFCKNEAAHRKSVLLWSFQLLETEINIVTLVIGVFSVNFMWNKSWKDWYRAGIHRGVLHWKKEPLLSLRKPFLLRPSSSPAWSTAHNR